MGVRRDPASGQDTKFVWNERQQPTLQIAY